MSKKADVLAIRALVYLALAVVAVVMAFPFYWMIVTSLQPLQAIYRYPPDFFPKSPSLANYITIFREYQFLRYTLNGLLVAGTAALGQLGTCSLAGFAFARMRFFAKELFFALILGSMIVPVEVVIIPEFLIMNSLGWVNSYLPLIVPSFLIGSTGTFLMRSFYENVPRELEDAAMIDGANAFQTYLRVFLPLSRPSLWTLFIVSFLIDWNALLRPLVYLSDRSMYTIPLGLTRFMGAYSTKWNLLLAGSVVSVVPILALYILMQRQFTEGITSTGLKG